MHLCVQEDYTGFVMNRDFPIETEPHTNEKEEDLDLLPFDYYYKAKEADSSDIHVIDILGLQILCKSLCPMSPGEQSAYFEFDQIDRQNIYLHLELYTFLHGYEFS